ncbi:MAG: RNA-binding protein [Bacteroidetes bacterium]|nr:RNA-binding protein [Bacteroidota bacterium]
MNIYVGNLAYGIREEELRSVFENHGAVDTVKIIMDRDTGRSKGFAFVEMPNDDESRTAIEQLNGVELQERSITVNEAKPRESRSSNHGDGGGYRGNRW